LASPARIIITTFPAISLPMRHTCNYARHRPYRSRALGCLACSVPVACALSFSDLPAGLRLQHTIVSVSKQRDAEHHDHSDHDAPHCMCHSMTFSRLLTQISVLTKCQGEIIPSTSPHVCTPKDFCGFRLSGNLRRIKNGDSESAQLVRCRTASSPVLT
jgi:hypothetical protein